jgi:nitrogen-specific signal transduction histidine kinase
VLSRVVSSNTQGFNDPYGLAEASFELEQSVINDILLAAFDQVEDIADSLRVDMDREKDLLRIVEKANITLSRISEKITLDQHIRESKTLPSLASLNDTLDSKSTLQAVAHEIRNPLTVIGGFARRLAASVEFESAGSRYATIILSEVERVEGLLSEMIYKTDQEQE